MTNNDGIDHDRLRAITEKIQVGDTDEGAEALAEVISVVRDQERADARQAVRHELADLQLKAENDAALGKFAKRYPALSKDPVLLEAGAHVLRDEMARDLKAAGVTDEELEPFREDVGRLASLHGKARLMRHEGVRSADKLLADVGDVLGEKFNLKPTGTGRTGPEYLRDLRAERGFKTRDEDPSGRRDGSRAPGSASLTTEESDRAATYIEKLRESRGFPSRASR